MKTKFIEMSTKLENKDLTSNDAKPVLGAVFLTNFNTMRKIEVKIRQIIWAFGDEIFNRSDKAPILHIPC